MSRLVIVPSFIPCLWQCFFSSVHGVHLEIIFPLAFFLFFTFPLVKASQPFQYQVDPEDSQKWDRIDFSFCRDVSHSAYLILHLNPHAAVAMDHMPERKYPQNTLLRSEKALTSSLLHSAVWGLNNYRWQEYTHLRADEHVLRDGILRETLRKRFGVDALANPGDYGPISLLDTLGLDLHRDLRLFRPLRNETGELFRTSCEVGRLSLEYLIRSSSKEAYEQFKLDFRQDIIFDNPIVAEGGDMTTGTSSSKKLVQKTSKRTV
ncbi:unnamed protein product, partial [Amoebophrya sp. A120]|eukprot:GSA120T00018381001.1